MSQQATFAPSGLAWAGNRTADYVELTKPRVVSMVLVATAAGFYLGETRSFDYLLALQLMIGTALAAGGTLALNEFVERDLDAKMARTRMRPLPDGRLMPVEALIFGVTIMAAGLAYLWFEANPLSAIVTAAITLLYLGVYTPLKRVSAICTVVGSIPARCRPWLDGRRLGVRSASSRSCCSRLCFCGNCRIRWRSPNFTGVILRAPESACCRSTIRMPPAVRL